MKQTLGAFNERRSEVLGVLAQLDAFVSGADAVGIKIDESLRTKLRNAIGQVAADKLKVVLVGGFSEGKTSIAAAWMERLENGSMNISHQESSNAVAVYDGGQDFELVDTPGLFGFKEKCSASSGEVEKYKDITRKYVSEAHLVLYVMGPANPVKESHREELEWLFRTLNLLPRTVFVLGRFDEVADVEDPEEYAQQLAIKRENVTQRLRQLIGLSEAEEAELSIVAVAANPFDKGMGHWLKHLDVFRELSHIGTLQAATSEKVAANGGALAIVEETRTSIARDVLAKQLPVAVENDERIGQEVARLETMTGRLQKQLGMVSSEVSEARSALQEFVLRYFADLILQAQGATLESFNQFFEREVGPGGIVVSTRLQNEFERQLRAVNLEIQRMSVDINAEVDHFNTAVGALGKQGLSYLLKNNVINNTSVLAARDGLASAAKFVGFDIGSMLKFKPWGATKLANGLNGVLSVVGLGLEVWDSWEQAKREEAFAKAIAEMVKNFNGQREELVQLLRSEGFVERFFPDYGELEGRIAEVNQAMEAGRRNREAFRKWRQMGEAIDAEFSVVEMAA
ncbi:LeoA/HP0731 family dynamin-like GTPase [Lysobacter korlensis]|uniref:LeoA/HP0731 family dynamin-like GTPase n=1 Tax=Lysobacter korlensis TaxID=553636 RepID=A0ABV6RV92_9GAMM